MLGHDGFVGDRRFWRLRKQPEAVGRRLDRREALASSQSTSRKIVCRRVSPTYRLCSMVFRRPLFWPGVTIVIMKYRERVCNNIYMDKFIGTVGGCHGLEMIW